MDLANDKQISIIYWHPTVKWLAQGTDDENDDGGRCKQKILCMCQTPIRIHIITKLNC